MKTPKIMISLIVIESLLFAVAKSSPLFMVYPVVLLALFLVPLGGLIGACTTHDSAEAAQDEAEALKERKGFRIRLSLCLALLGLSLMVLSVGGLFRIMHWPGAVCVPSLGAVASALMAIILFLYVRKNEKLAEPSPVSLYVLAALSFVFAAWRGAPVIFS